MILICSYCVRNIKGIKKINVCVLELKCKFLKSNQPPVSFTELFSLRARSDSLVNHLRLVYLIVPGGQFRNNPIGLNILKITGGLKSFEIVFFCDGWIVQLAVQPAPDAKNGLCKFGDLFQSGIGISSQLK